MNRTDVQTHFNLNVQVAEHSAKVVQSLLEAADLRQEAAELIARAARLTARALEQEAAAGRSARLAEMFTWDTQTERMTVPRVRLSRVWHRQARLGYLGAMRASFRLGRVAGVPVGVRSEERRVGQECDCRGF